MLFQIYDVSRSTRSIFNLRTQNDLLWAYLEKFGKELFRRPNGRKDIFVSRNGWKINGTTYIITYALHMYILEVLSFVRMKMSSHFAYFHKQII